jgi:hypothetical protein
MTAWIADISSVSTGVFNIPHGYYDTDGTIRIANANNLYINGNDTTIRYNPYGTSRAITLTKCKNVHISNLHVKAPGSFSKCIVISADLNGAVVKVLNDIPPISSGTVKVVVFRNGRFLPFFRNYVASATHITGNEYRVNYRRAILTKDGIPPKTGDIFCLGNRQGQIAVSLVDCVDCTVSNVIVHSAGNMAFSEIDCDNTLYESCHVRPDDLMSSNADGFHSRAPYRAPNYISCSVRGCGDDPMNVHGDVSVYMGEGLLLAKNSADMSQGRKLYYGVDLDCEIISAAELNDSTLHDKLCQDAALVANTWDTTKLFQVKLSKDLPIKTYLWDREPEGGSLIDFTATDCWTHSGIKWRTNNYRIERAITRKAGANFIDTALHNIWLEGPAGRNGIEKDNLLGLEPDLIS